MLIDIVSKMVAVLSRLQCDIICTSCSIVR